MLMWLIYVDGMCWLTNYILQSSWLWVVAQNLQDRYKTAVVACHEYLVAHGASADVLFLSQGFNIKHMPL